MTYTLYFKGGPLVGPEKDEKMILTDLPLVGLALTIILCVYLHYKYGKISATPKLKTVGWVLLGAGILFFGWAPVIAAAILLYMAYHAEGKI